MRTVDRSFWRNLEYLPANMECAAMSKCTFDPAQQWGAGGRDHGPGAVRVARALHAARRRAPRQPHAGPHRQQRRVARLGHDAMQYNTIRYSTVQYDTIQYSTMQYDTIRYDTIQ